MQNRPVEMYEFEGCPFYRKAPYFLKYDMI